MLINARTRFFPWCDDVGSAFSQIAALRTSGAVSDTASVPQAEEEPLPSSAGGSNVNDDGVGTVLAHMKSSELKALVKREIDALRQLGASGTRQAAQFQTGLGAALTKADLISLVCL